MFKSLFRSCPSKPQSKDEIIAVWISVGVVVLSSLSVIID